MAQAGAHALWAAAGLGIALALPGAVVDVAHDVLRLIVGQRVSLAGIAAGVVALGVATWAAAAARVARRLISRVGDESRVRDDFRRTELISDSAKSRL